MSRDNSFFRNNGEPDPEDYFKETRMSFGDHLEELRLYLWRALIGFFIIMIMVFVLDGIGYATGTGIGIGKPVMDVIAMPVEKALDEFYRERVKRVQAQLAHDDPALLQADRPTEFVQVGFYRPQLEAVLKGQSTDEVNGFKKPVVAGSEGNPAVPMSKDQTVEVGEDQVVKLWVREEHPVQRAALLQEAERIVGRRPQLSTLSAQEAFMVYFKVALVCGLVLGSPWIFWNIWMFVAAGLYPEEKRYVHVYLPFSLALFLAGVILCEFVVLPKAVGALLWFNEWMDLEPDLRLEEWLSFAIWMPVIFGVAFQTPLVMLFLERFGILTIEQYREKRKIAWFVMLVVAAVISPSIDAVSLFFLWVPMGFLYELGIILCRLKRKHPDDLDLDESESENMVGV
jgi:sec-independent protein translocase protein TatC